MYLSLAQALEELHGRIAQVTLELDEDALHWQPTPELDSVHSLITQVALEEYRWIGEAVAGLQTDVVPLPADEPLDHPLFRLGSVGQVSQVILANLAASDWVAPRQVDGRTLTVAGCILHILEELARALGRIEVTAGLWRARS